RVRVEAFSKIMPRVRPESGRGQCENGFSRIALSSAARRNSAFISSAERSQRERRSRLAMRVILVLQMRLGLIVCLLCAACDDDVKTPMDLAVSTDMLPLPDHAPAAGTCSARHSCLLNRTDANAPGCGA